MKAVHFSIRGRVQGVGYRAGFAREAQALGLSGWVRNRGDGSVEALVRGEAGAIERLAAWGRTGPPAARVDALVLNDQADGGQANAGFVILATL